MRIISLLSIVAMWHVSFFGQAFANPGQSSSLPFPNDVTPVHEPVHDHGGVHHGGMVKDEREAAPVFVASTAKSFSALMDDAMVVMEYGMHRAPMNGQQEHDFVTMMIPHHQGAIDMAKALLLRTTDPALRNLALGIIAEQQVEIQQMQQWLAAQPGEKGDAPSSETRLKNEH